MRLISGFGRLRRQLAVAALNLLVAGSHSVAAQETWHPANGPLMTRWAKEISPTNALPDYPRPQLVRADWQNLNGLWDYTVTDKAATAPPAGWDGRILVPYPIESALSGVMKALLPTQRLWYRRKFTIPAAWGGKQVQLHFGAVDWESEVWVNGRSLGTHRGGYDGFSFDVTRLLRQGENEVVVAARNPVDTGWQLRGKQTLHPAGAAYTACSGIWQTVWLEPLPESAVDTLHIVPDPSLGVVHVTVNARIAPRPMTVRVTVFDRANQAADISAPIGVDLESVQGNLVQFYKATSAAVTATVDLPLPKAHLWTPDDPYLYDLTVSLMGTDGTMTDTVDSYFGMRSLGIGKDALGNMRFLLNGKVRMLPLVLDQGYWPDGIYTSPTDAALRFDLEAEKQLGVDVRKHVKVEPDRWYYWADKLGVLVLQDMPTGNEGDPHTDLSTSPEAAAECESEMRALIVQRWNHPSIISWNMFNEGWGQHDTVATAAWAKALDPSRLIDEASGFPWHGAGDIRDCHGGVPPKSATEISIDTEDGSVGLATPGHDWPIGTLWTPVTYNPKTDGDAAPVVDGHLALLTDTSRLWFTRRVRAMFRALWANRDATGQSGDSYCQIVDVETEEDGLISYDRAIWKVDPAPIRAAARGSALAEDVAAIVPTALTQPIEWRYITTSPAADWASPAFDDAHWKTGLFGFGAGYDHVQTPRTDTPGDIYLRKTFMLDRLPTRALLLRMRHDADVEVYLNGVLACKNSGFINSYDDFPIAPAALRALHAAKNVIAVHCRQTTGGQYIDVGLLETETPVEHDEHSNPLPFLYEVQGKRQKEVRDPCIIRDGDTYYLVFTMWPFANREESRMTLPDNGSSPGIRMYSSKNLQTWKEVGWLVKSDALPLDCPYKHRFWAPEIHKIGGKFYLIFTGDNWLKKEYNPAGTWGAAGYTFIGVADKVTGPYRHISYLPGGACDTSLFTDTDGQVYAVMPKYDMFIQKIDLSHIEQGKVKLVGEEKKVLTCKSEDIPFPVSPDYLEGPWMEKIGGEYVLFYAEPFRDKRAPGYWMGAAYADSPLGPWRKDPRGQVFEGGHLSVFDSAGGRKWFAYRSEQDDRNRGLLCVAPFGLDSNGKIKMDEERP